MSAMVLANVPGTGGHGAVIVLAAKSSSIVWAMALALTFQRGVAETVAVGQVLVAVRILRRLHHQ